MIEAFLDESGTEREARCMAVAAYAAPYENWRGFERKWTQVLEDAGLDFFHAKEAKCDPLRPILWEQMQRFSLSGFLYTTFRGDYRKYAGESYKSLLGNDYAVCTYSCVLEICKWVKAENLGYASFVIEAGQPNSEFVEEVIKGLMADCPEILSVGVARKEEFPQLQTADFLAHCGVTYDRQWLDQLIGEGPGTAGHGHLGEEELTPVSKAVEKLFRQMRRQKNELRKRRRKAR